MNARGGWALGLVLLIVGTPPVKAASAIVSLRTQGRRHILGSGDTPFKMPSDCAVGPAGQLYVLDGVHHRIVVFDANGTYLSQFGEPGTKVGQLHYPLGITTAPDGTVYVADSGNHRIQSFTAQGVPVATIDLPDGHESRADPTDVAVDPLRRRLYIADNENHRILPYDLSGQTLLPAWGSPGQGRRQFRYPFLLDTTPDGYLLVVEPINTRVQVLNAQGKFVNFVGAWGTKAGQLFRPKGVVVIDRHAFVTDSYLGRIQVFHLHGDFLGVLADSAGAPVALTTPMGLAVDTKRHHLYVVELKANRVTCLDLE